MPRTKQVVTAPLTPVSIEQRLDRQQAQYYRELCNKLSACAAAIASNEAEIKRLAKKLESLDIWRQYQSRRQQLKALTHAMNELSLMLRALIESALSDVPGDTIIDKIRHLGGTSNGAR